ncbi:hypothetical protein EYZ11_010473 [Aspergillus tanneri]|uniref:Uncharacterized protein n=1 Tax=Aspergillus tanneri TaxID=1220188 RepID=A0A4S3J7F7_9EURO|nr:hypothetical protein EYZ11_010473 [Aspergillus tanneri]
MATAKGGIKIAISVSSGVLVANTLAMSHEIWE